MYFKQLTKTKKTVFSINDLRLLWQIKNKNYLKTVINRLLKRKELFRLKRGVYVLDNNQYNPIEASNKIRTNSYVSLETVLQKEGIIFQDYSNSIYAVSDNTLKYKIDQNKFYYFKIKDDILFNTLGIENTNGYNIATKERAIADRLYLTPGYYFDNLKNIDIKKLKKISQIYNKRTRKEIEKLIKEIQKYA